MASLVALLIECNQIIQSFSVQTIPDEIKNPLATVLSLANHLYENRKSKHILVGYGVDVLVERFRRRLERYI